MGSREPQRVYLLWHTHDLENGESDEKLLGVYSTEAKAKSRMAAAMSLPGFREAPAGFEVTGYALDHDEWTEGFVTS